ncbi:MAG: fused MFS/spermidine synthase [Bacillota bacterium]
MWNKWKGYLLLFVSSGCTMTIELVAGRLVAPYVGVSLYTWTGIIGACLTGMGLGSLAGGWLADRGEPRRWLARLFLVASGLVGLLLFQPLIEGMTQSQVFLQMPPLMGIFNLSMLLFGLPCFFLAAISPLVYKIALQESSRLGTTVGRLAASGIAGSILGTYLTGFWLIPTFGLKAILTGVTALTGLLGAFSLTWATSRRTVTAAVLAAIPWLLVARVPALAASICDTESAYYCIRVDERKAKEGGGQVKVLRLDYLVHSGIQVGKPDHLWYEYEAVAAWILQARREYAPKTLFLGGGGYVLPHWVERQFPKASVDVVEIDPAVTRTALKEFVPGARRIRSHHMDARLALLRFPAERRFDIIFGDVFNDLSVPYHLTTAEFAGLVKSRLTEDGLYLLNVVDDREKRPLVGALTATLRTVFPHVEVLPGSDSDSGRGPHLVVASLRPLPLARWAEHWSRPPFDVAPIAMDGEHPVLTDDYAPTDRLLLPVFADRWKP